MMLKIRLLSALMVLIATGVVEAGQRTEKLCRIQALFANSEAVLAAPIESEVLRVFETVTTQPVMIHYTSQVGITRMASMGRILADSKSRVFFSDEPFSALEAERNLFINAPRYRGKADYVIILKRTSLPELENNSSNPFEFILRGSYRIEKEQLIYWGPNPF